MKYYCIATTIIFQFVFHSFLFSAEYKFVEKLKQEIAEKRWKEANCVHQPNNITVSEWIPHDQTLENFSEMVAINSFDLSTLPGRPKSAGEFLKVLRRTTLQSYVDTPVKWNVLRLSYSDALYEWSLPKRKDNVLHEICRVVLEGKELNSVTYIKKFGEIDSKSRQKWIERLGGER